MHPLTRDLYKRAILVGRDYPHRDGLDYVRRTWKVALRDPSNCPIYCSWLAKAGQPHGSERAAEAEIRKAVARGRFMVREMEGIVQLRKYRAMKKRYGSNNDGPDVELEAQRLAEAAKQFRIGTTNS